MLRSGLTQPAVDALARVTRAARTDALGSCLCSSGRVATSRPEPPRTAEADSPKPERVDARVLGDGPSACPNASAAQVAITAIRGFSMDHCVSE